MAHVLAGEENNLRKDHIITEVKKQSWLSVPIIVSGVLEKLIQIISLSFVGHLGELPLSAASMATSISGITGISILMGMGNALDTLCGQAYGAKEYHLLGLYLQKAMLVNTIVCMPLAFVWAFAGEILHAIGQNKEISMAAQLYARCMIPVLFTYGILQCYYRFLQAQNIAFPMMLTSGFTILVHIFTCWLLIIKWKIGYTGAAIANSLSYCLSLVLIASYVRLSSRFKHTWTGFSKQALHDFSSLLRLAIPSALMGCLEYWSFEAIVLMSGFLPNPKLETSVLAICTRVSNELGAGNPQNARSAIYVAGTIAILEGLIVGSTLFLARNDWGKIFSNKLEVIKYIARVMPLLALSHLIDACQCVLLGIVRGCGWQKLAVFVNIGAFYIVGLPFAALFAFYLHLKAKGLWLGIICGLSTQTFSLFIITLFTNWEKQAKKAVDRVNKSTVAVGLVTTMNDNPQADSSLREEVQASDDCH
ncbi:Multi antimicrobial extrusion protein [Dioscorea alata]|uniref:Multi antimicrobial extrusion protein n=1 Tax=Dioscorea alata TaxID=55571 RepID=A0ACB7VKD0_DIOAL|nr:Multi antimicrobial extrusion protein [Dioscorea alata]